MAKVCSVCGNMCADNAAKCDVCGKEFTSKAPTQPGYGQMGYTQSGYAHNSYSQSGYNSPYAAQNFSAAEPTPMMAKKSGNKTAALILALIIIAVVTFVMVILPLIMPRPYEKGLDKFFGSLEDQDSQALVESLYYDKILDAAKEQAAKEDPTSAQEIDTVFYNVFNLVFEQMEEEVGENYSLKYKVDDTKKLKKGDCDDITADYAELLTQYDATDKAPDVDEAYEVDVTFTFKADKTHSEEGTVIVFKADNDWFVAYPSRSELN